MSQKKSTRVKGESAARGEARRRGAAQLGATGRNILHKRVMARSKPLLTDRQRAAARLLAMGRRVGDVAAELSLHRGTLLRWRELPVFQDELARLHEEFAAAGSVGSPSMTAHRRRAKDPRPLAQRLTGDGLIRAGGFLETMLADIERQTEANRLRRQQLSTSAGES
jgi:hypothetical protein